MTSANLKLLRRFVKRFPQRQVDFLASRSIIEVRIWNQGNQTAYFNYYAGAEYKDRQYEAGGARLGGEMTYDSYECTLPSCKAYLGKFYFTASNQLLPSY